MLAALARVVRRYPQGRPSCGKSRELDFFEQISDWKLVPLLLLFLLRQFEYHLYRLCFATAARLNASFAHKSPLKRIAEEAEEN